MKFKVAVVDCISLREEGVGMGCFGFQNKYVLNLKNFLFVLLFVDLLGFAKKHFSRSSWVSEEVI